MGNQKGAYIAEYKVYENPKDPENSDYDVLLWITSLDAVVDPVTGKRLRTVLAEMSASMSTGDITTIQTTDRKHKYGFRVDDDGTLVFVYDDI